MNARIFIGNTQVDSLPANDRGLAYGDGLFETMLVHRGDVPWWDAHWSRLEDGAARLQISLPDAPVILGQASELFNQQSFDQQQIAQQPIDQDRGVLKLIVTRGGSGRGYRRAASTEPNWVVSRHRLPAKPCGSGLMLRWCDTRLAIQPALAGIKHCNRLEQVVARAEWHDDGIDDGLMCDSEGFVVSATSANLFVLREGGWMTPMVDRCGIAGVCRAWCMTDLAAVETRLTIAQVESADAIFLCNAVRGILPVAQLVRRAWSPHPQVAALQARLARVHPAFASDLEVP